MDAKEVHYKILINTCNKLDQSQINDFHISPEMELFLLDLKNEKIIQVKGNINVNKKVQFG